MYICILGMLYFIIISARILVCYIFLLGSFSRGNSLCDWSFSPSIGNSEGLLSIWCSSKGSCLFYFMGSGYFGVCLEWGISKVKCVVVNIYSKCSPSEKRALWRDLILRKDSFGGNICYVLGDFNYLFSPSKRLESDSPKYRVQNYLCVEFCNFISVMQLWYLPILGRSFTWFKPKGRISSHLNRIIISVDWWELWGTTSQWALPRDVSDHFQLFSNIYQLWGPKPFWFNNHWLNHPQLLRVVFDSWFGSLSSRRKAFVINEKLKALEGVLKVWNKGVISNKEMESRNKSSMDIKVKKQMRKIGIKSSTKHIDNMDLNCKGGLWTMKCKGWLQAHMF